MANSKNLRPPTPSEARERGKKGGIASGKARRRRKTAKECAEIYLSLPILRGENWDSLLNEGIEPDDIDNMMMLVASMIKAGQSGDVQAFKAILGVIGEDRQMFGDDEHTGVIEIGEVRDKGDAAT